MSDTIAPNPFDPAALRLKSSFSGSVAVKKLLTRVPVKKPDKQTWFRVHPNPDFRLDMGVIQLKDEGETYAVIPDLQDEFADLMVPVTVYTYVTRQGATFLWPVRLPGEDGKTHDAWTSSHGAAERATESWTRMQWSPQVGAYDISVATGIVAEPVWPDVSFGELLRIGFQGKLIDKADHLLIQKLRGTA